MTERQKNYQRYLRSDHWRDLKAEKQKRTAKRCAVCGNENNVQCHHLNYRDLFSVETSDLRWLCARCHKLAHDLMKEGKIRFKSDSQHHRFAVTKNAMKKHWGLNYNDLVFGHIPPEA